MELWDQLKEAEASVRERMGDRRPTVGLILGSGLGAFADQLEDAVAIPYDEVPHFPVSTVEGHAGRFVVGRSNGVDCIAMQGRVHYYEGFSIQQVAFPVRVMIALGAGSIVITNAAGGIGSHLRVGSLMLITDYLNLMGVNPLRGENDDRLGERFPDMTEAFEPELRALAEKAAERRDVALEKGVYVGLSGPSYETPAEIEMLRRLGGDAVGMSTVPETIAANHQGARVLGISCITNLAAGSGEGGLSHDDVTEVAARVRGEFTALLEEIVARIGGS